MLFAFVLALSLGSSVYVSAATSSSHNADPTSAPTSASAGASSNSIGSASDNSIGTPSNTAALPSLSGVSSCVNNCLELAVSADNCMSLVAVDCFCPDPKPYTAAFVSCLTGCPSEVASAEALVEQFCALAATPTSLSFPSFTPSSASGASSNSSSSAGIAGASGISASATAPPTSAASTTLNSAAARTRSGTSALVVL
ncbi:hypothetical protein K438DRAFT_543946 [Mycena galopus ATCC 62051]|nr:hypothetical protein K438DRAFT_543946 [Mycena galopus ATCC 62051]